MQDQSVMLWEHVRHYLHWRSDITANVEYGLFATLKVTKIRNGLLQRMHWKRELLHLA